MKKSDQTWSPLAPLLITSTGQQELVSNLFKADLYEQMTNTANYIKLPNPLRVVFSPAYGIPFWLPALPRCPESHPFAMGQGTTCCSHGLSTLPSHFLEDLPQCHAKVGNYINFAVECCIEAFRIPCHFHMCNSKSESAIEGMIFTALQVFDSAILLFEYGP